jgi:hypothetical protein
MTTTTHTTRLDDIADRNTRSRVTDLLFSSMIALLLVLCLASLRAAASPSVSYSATHSAVTEAHVADTGAVCDVEAAC